MIRVRASLCDSDFCRKLRGKIPKDAFTIPECVPHKHPGTLLKAFPADNAYSDLGIVTELLLQKKVIDLDALVGVCQDAVNIDLPTNVLKAKTTHRYIENVQNTATKLATLVGAADVSYNAAVNIDGCNIVGHPDILTPTGIFEVKTTGQMKTSWTQFLLQTFCYAALNPSATHVHIVLPLQEHVWTWNVRDDWPKRTLFVDVMKNIHPPAVENDAKKKMEDEMFGPLLFSTFPIGCHIAKKKKMSDTVQALPSFQRPYQVFLTKTTKLAVLDNDIAETSDIIYKTGAKMFIHSPYLLNLSLEPGSEDNYVVDCLKQHLATASAMGARGVVVHVGKACSLTQDKALDNMRINIQRSLSAATPQCPLLLETPAGQGTETLTTLSDFMDFVCSIPNTYFGVCIDTCHTFAAGIQPLEYLKAVASNPLWLPYLKLIHFNDSKASCGSCVDRHAPLGKGLIPKEQLVECASLATIHNIPMLVE